MNTALIIRPADAPSIHVLECDGPRRKYAPTRGNYRLATDNQPPSDYSSWNAGYPLDPRLKDWGEPHWEVYQLHDGSVEIHACRPTNQEALRGDLHGRWGSVIHLGRNPSRDQLRLGLQLARLLCKCLPTIGFCVSPNVMFHIQRIETNIPVKSSTGVRFSSIPKAS